MSKRNFPGKDSEMLICVSAITQAAITHKAILIANRASWADPFFATHITRIDAAINTILGVDSALALRTQTATVTAIVRPVKQNLADVKVMMEQDFKSDKVRLNELMTNLGFKEHWKAASRFDQESLMELLFQFKINLTTPIRTELETKGISSTLLTDIVDAAQALSNANISQETLKQSRKAITETFLAELNAIYSDTMAISQISQRFFKNSPAIQDQFNYSKLLKNLRGNTLTTLFDGDVIVSPDQPFVLDSPRITTKTIITAHTTSNLIYACRNEAGCVSSGIDSYHITPEIDNTIRKTDLVGEGSKLVLTNLTPGFATVKLKIQG